MAEQQSIPIIVGEDGKRYYDMPGMKPRLAPTAVEPSGRPSVPAGMMPFKEGFRPLMPGETQPEFPKAPGDVGEAVHQATSTPQIVAALVGMLTEGAALPMLAAGGTSLLHSATDKSGDMSPESAAGGALMNGAAAGIPYGAAKVAEGGVAGLADAASAFPSKIGMMMKTIRAAMGGSEAAAAPVATSAAGDAGQYATPAMQTRLVKAMVDLENQLATASGPAKVLIQRQLATLEDLNMRAVAQMQNVKPDLDGVLSHMGLTPVVTAASSLAKTAATKAAAQRDTIVNALRAILGAGQAGEEMRR
jgi:hypothetical protein